MIYIKMTNSKPQLVIGSYPINTLKDIRDRMALNAEHRLLELKRSRYLPPNHQKNTPTQSGDIWSLGVILFEWISRDINATYKVDMGMAIEEAINVGYSENVTNLLRLCLSED